MFTFSFEDKIKFTKAVYYHFHKIPLPKPFKDGTGGMGKFAPEQGCIERKHCKIKGLRRVNLKTRSIANYRKLSQNIGGFLVRNEYGFW